MTQKKHSSSLSRHSSEIKLLIFFEYNKPDKQNLYGIHLFQTFSVSQ